MWEHCVINFRTAMGMLKLLQEKCAYFYFLFLFFVCLFVFGCIILCLVFVTGLIVFGRAISSGRQRAKDCRM